MTLKRFSIHSTGQYTTMRWKQKRWMKLGGDKKQWKEKYLVPQRHYCHVWFFLLVYVWWSQSLERKEVKTILTICTRIHSIIFWSWWVSNTRDTDRHSCLSAIGQYRLLQQILNAVNMQSMKPQFQKTRKCLAWSGRVTNGHRFFQPSPLKFWLHRCFKEF